ncbi:type III-B CRISPR module RAMP protein Cmr6 [Acidithiobacillus caldus]
MSLGRQSVNEIHRAIAITSQEEIHPALRLAHGLDEWPGDGDPQRKHKLLEDICRLRVPRFYRNALQRWQRYTKDKTRFSTFELALENRLYLGVTRDNPVETGVTVSYSYGMPILPGSSIKGLTRASAEYVSATSGTLSPAALRWMFGEGGDAGEGGGLIFHDAWWCGNLENPFVADIVTPHHKQYYRGGEGPASDTESPIPAGQIAVQGSFYFVIEGDPGWTPVAAHLLKSGLQQWGIGGKKSSGYGLFLSEK